MQGNLKLLREKRVERGRERKSKGVSQWFSKYGFAFVGMMSFWV